MIDFSLLPRRNKTYAGANGSKIAVILPRIDMKKIDLLIDETPFISDLQKRFYKTMLAERKEKILDRSLQKIRKKERNLAR